MKRSVFILVALLLLSGCIDSDGKEANSKIVRDQIGRFAIVPAQNGYPAVVLDTTSGCVMTITRAENGTISMDEVAFSEGTNSCNTSKQLLVVDTLSRVVK